MPWTALNHDDLHDLGLYKNLFSNFSDYELLVLKILPSSKLF